MNTERFILIKNQTIEMRFLSFLATIILLLFLASCTGQQKSDEIKEDVNWVNFKSEKYGFSFSFPNNWKEYYINIHIFSFLFSKRLSLIYWKSSKKRLKINHSSKISI